MQRHLKVCLVGAGGRMGRRCVRLLHGHPRLRLYSALLRHPEAAGSELPDGVQRHRDPAQALRGCDVALDFAAPPVCATLLPACCDAGVPCVVAATGLQDHDRAAIAAAAAHIAVLPAPNLSLGVNVLLGLVERAAAQLGGFDVGIFELHHRHKRDAPSGTALALGAAARRGAAASGPAAAPGVAAAPGAPLAGDAVAPGFASLRGGDVAGEHTVSFWGEGERLELVHRAGNADIFAAGALRAAAFLVGRPPGCYRMADVLDAP